MAVRAHRALMLNLVTYPDLSRFEPPFAMHSQIARLSQRLASTLLTVGLVAWLTLLPALPAVAGNLPGHGQLRSTLQAVVEEGNGGLGNPMWATVVDRDGFVQVVAFSGKRRGDQWPGSRAIAAQKANTANAFSLPDRALSTANLYSAVQPGNPLYGLPSSNPVDTDVIYQGPHQDIGTVRDPMVGQKSGGICVFGGGLPLYDRRGNLIGGLGVSGDSACADHNIAWKLRHALNLDNVPDGVSPSGDDNIIYDRSDGSSASGWGHPNCSSAATEIATQLPETHPVGPEQ